MKKKMMALHKNQIWDLVDLPKGWKAIGYKWVYKIKRETDRMIQKYRERLVVKRFTQKKSMDFFEVFALVVKLDSIYLVLSLVATNDLKLEQLDIKMVYCMMI